MNNRFKINEIFYSLQGEGFHSGIPAVFIRFSGCNLHCSFCDTDHSQGSFMSTHEIISKVLEFKQAPLIVLTGGEPSLFINHSFIQALKEATHMTIAIETNGTNSLPDNIDWVTLSPKFDFVGSEGAVKLSRCDELKVVYTGQSLDHYFNIQASHYFLQPCFCDDHSLCVANQQATIQAILSDPRWRLSLQAHRILNIR